MLNRTVRQNIEMAAGTAEILELNPRLIKESEVFSYSYHQVATDILSSEYFDWDKISMLDFGDRNSSIEFSETRAVSVEDEDFKIVCENFQSRPGVNRVQFAYLTRLVLLYTRKKLRDIKEQEKEKQPERITESEDLSRMTRLEKYIQLLQKNDENSINKIKKIDKILGGLIDDK